jgi:predicted metal-dependent HD superfamily phosphohydrolase
MDSELVRKSRVYAEEILKNLPKEYTYHNLAHTTQVAAAAEEIGKASNLSAEELESVIIAAWLHDTGYRENCNSHEEVSKQQATKLLNEWGAAPEKIEQVKKLIEATRMPQQPVTLAEQVLCDADLQHLGDEDIMECGEQIRKEFETFKGLKFETDEEWIRHNLNFFNTHKYFTP